MKLQYYARPDSIAREQLRATIELVVACPSGVLGAALLRSAGSAALPFPAGARPCARKWPPLLFVPAVGVAAPPCPTAGPYPEKQKPHSSGASTQLLLFIFLNSLTGAARLIKTRRLGVARRMLSTPTAVRTIPPAKPLGRLSVALAPGAADRRRLVRSSSAFHWGNPARNHRRRHSVLRSSAPGQAP